MAAYLSNSAYLSKYGDAETKRLTDDDKSGAVDTAKLTEALEDATVVVEGYIGKRYQTPVSDPPRLLQTFVGALAREALHKNQVPEVVLQDADRARAQLKDISRGTMSLPIAEGGTKPTETGSSESASSNDAPSTIFSEDNLADYTNFGSGGYNAKWKG